MTIFGFSLFSFLPLYLKTPHPNKGRVLTLYVILRAFRPLWTGTKRPKYIQCLNTFFFEVFWKIYFPPRRAPAVSDYQPSEGRPPIHNSHRHPHGGIPLNPYSPQKAGTHYINPMDTIEMLYRMWYGLDRHGVKKTIPRRASIFWKISA